MLKYSLSFFMVLIFLFGCDSGSSFTQETTPNVAPIANAGADQNINTATAVTLDGSASSDMDSDSLSYIWSFTTQPEESNATLSDTHAINPSFVADVEGLYVLSLIVNDGVADSMADTVTITATADEFRTIIFDDFNDTNQTLWLKADWANGDPFYNAWCPEQIDINNSILTLTLEQKDCHSYTHASGEYRTVNTYKYGKYTARFQASDVNGTISSLFVYTGPAEGTEWDEIDIEILGKDATKVQFNYWRNGHEHPATFDLGFDASLAMHTYAFVWHPDYIEWYVDDLLMYTVTENNNSDSDSLPVNAAKIIINLWAATGIDSWSGAYTDNTTVQTLYDYVKYEEFIAN